MNVVRQRTRDRGVRFGPLAKKRFTSLVVASTALAVVGTGTAVAATNFGQHQVGTEYDEGLQISSNQILKPLGDRLSTPYGKIMGSTVSPDGHFLAATANDRSVSLQIYDLST